MTIERFRAHALPGDRDAWNRPAFLGVDVVLDRLDGEIGRLVEAKRALDRETATAIAAASLDDYINSLDEGGEPVRRRACGGEVSAGDLGSLGEQR